MPGGSTDVLLTFSLAVLAFGGFEAAAPLASRPRTHVLGVVIMYQVANVTLIVERARLRRRGVRKNPAAPPPPGRCER